MIDMTERRLYTLRHLDREAALIALSKMVREWMLVAKDCDIPFGDLEANVELLVGDICRGLGLRESEIYYILHGCEDRYELTFPVIFPGNGEWQNTNIFADELMSQR